MRKMSRFRRWVERTLKSVCVNLGMLLPSRLTHGIYVLTNYMLLGRWLRTQELVIPMRLPQRSMVFDVVASSVADRPVLYLEFGVASGNSLRYWSAHLRHPDSLLYGFDSFEGLPEDFDMFGSLLKGSFTQHDRLPVIDDARVHLVKGWFDDTVPRFEVPPHELLIVNIDADLYSSTKTVLNALRPHLRPGNYIYFDDMGRIDHEPKALREYMRETGMRLEVIAADVTCNNIFFRITG